jgi:hypothetical protein
MGDAFHRLQPTRPCNVWKHSTTDGAGRITRLVFAYDFWSPDPIFHDVPYQFVTRSMADVLATTSLTGYSLEDVPTIRSDEYDGSQALAEPEPVCWLKVHGHHGKDDFGMQNRAYLVVSDAALDHLRRKGLQRAEVLPYDPNRGIPTMEELVAELKGRTKSHPS